MASDISYDCRNLQRLFEELTPKRRAQAIKGALRRAANTIRRVAVNNLRSSLNSNRDLERGVRAMVWKRQAGFRVTVGPKAASRKTGKGERGYYLSRKIRTRMDKKKRTGVKIIEPKGKPVLMWAESGTNIRKTKTHGWFTRSRKGHSTGRMKRYGFMARTKSETEANVTSMLHTEIINNVKRVAKKYGCK